MAGMVALLGFGRPASGRGPTTLVAVAHGHAQHASPTAPASGATLSARITLLSALPAVPRSSCRMCGSGIPDARLSPSLSMGADSSSIFSQRLRVFLRKVEPTPGPHREMLLSVDVGSNSGLFLLGSRF
jgi:hypothetical protein